VIITSVFKRKLPTITVNNLVNNYFVHFDVLNSKFELVVFQLLKCLFLGQ